MSFQIGAAPAKRSIYWCPLTGKYHSCDRVVLQLSTPHRLTTMLRCLLPTLYNHDRNTAIDYRKAPRGLIFPLEVPGLFTRIASSPDANLGQWRSGYSIHASHQLSGKVLRYLKRVIVTPAVYRCFLPLNRKFTYRHWAGIRGSTQPCGLAAPYVFIKQSDPPCHCDLLFHIECRKQALLLPKVRS